MRSHSRIVFNGGFSLIEVLISVAVATVAVAASYEVTKSPYLTEGRSSAGIELQEFYRIVNYGLSHKKNSKVTSNNPFEKHSWGDCLNDYTTIEGSVEDGLNFRWMEINYAEQNFAITRAYQVSKNISVSDIQVSNIIQIKGDIFRGDLIFDLKVPSYLKAKASIEKSFPIVFKTKDYAGKKLFMCIIDVSEDEDDACSALGAEERNNTSKGLIATGDKEMVYEEVFKCPDVYELKEAYGFKYCEHPKTLGMTAVNNLGWQWVEKDVMALGDVNSEESCQAPREDSCSYMGGKIDSEGKCDFCAAYGGVRVNGYCSLLPGSPVASGSESELVSRWHVIEEIYDTAIKITLSGGTVLPVCSDIMQNACTLGEKTVCAVNPSLSEAGEYNSWLNRLECK